MGFVICFCYIIIFWVILLIDGMQNKVWISTGLKMRTWYTYSRHSHCASGRASHEYSNYKLKHTRSFMEFAIVKEYFKTWGSNRYHTLWSNVTRLWENTCYTGGGCCLPLTSAWKSFLPIAQMNRLSAITCLGARENRVCFQPP